MCEKVRQARETGTFFSKVAGGGCHFNSPTHQNLHNAITHILNSYTLFFSELEVHIRCMFIVES